MKGFDEAWLRDYEAKRSASVLEAGAVQFTLNEPYKLLNVWQRMHWKARANYARKLSGQIAKLTAHRVGAPPLPRARVEIERHSVQEPDDDGLRGGVKPLIDCLLVRCERHPHGLGFIVDDKPGCLQTVVQHVKSPTLRGQCTVVRIEPWQ